MSLFSDKKQNRSVPEKGTDCDFSPLSAFSLCDFHSHILPGMDDGSKDAAMSLAMLEEEKKQGIGTVLLTPHFYPDKEYPETFLQRRREAAAALSAAAQGKNLPALIPGAETAYFDGMGYVKNLPDCCIAGTRFLLVEMPFSHWSKGVMKDLILMRENLGIQPIVAHIERYPHEHKREIFRELRNHDILIQSNAEFFLDPHTRKKAFEMLDAGIISLLGTDSHNMSDRSPNLGRAALVIREIFGDEPLVEMASLEQMILYNATPLF